MVSSSRQQATGASRGRRVLISVVLVAILGGVLFRATRHRPLPAAPVPAAHRQDLELRTGRWFAPGQTNGFTGLLFDTYEDGATKSRTAISNGLPHGLSEGWHTNGQRQVEEYFVAGTSHGLRTKWHPNGQKQSEVAVAEGKLHGIFRSWHPNGERAEEVTLKDGQPDGLSRAWFSSGFLKSQVNLRNGTVVDQRFWKDRECKEADPTGPGLLSGN